MSRDLLDWRSYYSRIGHPKVRQNKDMQSYSSEFHDKRINEYLNTSNNFNIIKSGGEEKQQTQPIDLANIMIYSCDLDPVLLEDGDKTTGMITTNQAEQDFKPNESR